MLEKLVKVLEDTRKELNKKKPSGSFSEEITLEENGMTIELETLAYTDRDAAAEGKDRKVRTTLSFKDSGGHYLITNGEEEGDFLFNAEKEVADIYFPMLQAVLAVFPENTQKICAERSGEDTYFVLTHENTEGNEYEYYMHHNLAERKSVSVYKYGTFEAFENPQRELERFKDYITGKGNEIFGFNDTAENIVNIETKMSDIENVLKDLDRYSAISDRVKIGEYGKRKPFGFNALERETVEICYDYMDGNNLKVNYEIMKKVADNLTEYPAYIELAKKLNDIYGDSLKIELEVEREPYHSRSVETDKEEFFKKYGKTEAQEEEPAAEIPSDTVESLEGFMKQLAGLKL